MDLRRSWSPGIMAAVLAGCAPIVERGVPDPGPGTLPRVFVTAVPWTPSVSPRDVASAIAARDHHRLRRLFVERGALLELSSERGALHAVRPELVLDALPEAFREAFGQQEAADAAFAGETEPGPLRDAFSRFPCAAKPWRRLGELFLEEGRVADARACFERARDSRAQARLEAARPLPLSELRVELGEDSIWTCAPDGRVAWERSLVELLGAAPTAARVARRSPELTLVEALAGGAAWLVGVDPVGPRPWRTELLVQAGELAFDQEYALTPSRIYVARRVDIPWSGSATRGVVQALDARTGERLWLREVRAGGLPSEERRDRRGTTYAVGGTLSEIWEAQRVQLAVEGEAVRVSLGRGPEYRLEAATGRLLEMRER